MKRLDPKDIGVCSIVVSELLAGCYGAKDPQAEQAKVAMLRQLFSSLPFDDRAAEAAAKVHGHLTTRGERLGQGDLYIAAIAITHDLTLVTHNLREFSRVPGLRTEDWQDKP